MREGDMPAFLYVIDPMHTEETGRDYANASEPNWGGQYKQTIANRPYFTDYPGNVKNDQETINEWRVDFLNSWQERLDWLSKQ